MKNYRIKKVTDGYGTRYYPQHKFLGLFWVNTFGWEHYWDGSYDTFEQAKKHLCDFLRKPVVEYSKVDCSK